MAASAAKRGYGGRWLDDLDCWAAEAPDAPMFRDALFRHSAATFALGL